MITHLYINITTKSIEKCLVTFNKDNKIVNISAKFYTMGARTFPINPQSYCLKEYIFAAKINLSESDSCILTEGLVFLSFERKKK